MAELESRSVPNSSSTANDVRPLRAVVVTDEVDRRILTVLARDARTPNNAVAAEVGVAPSTCLARMRALRDGGVIRGYHADLDPAALGRPLQALVSVRLSSGARGQLRSFTDRIRSRPEVRSVYFLAGGDDFLLDVTAVDVADLRDFVVEELSAHPEVASTETNLVFEHVRGTAGAL